MRILHNSRDLTYRTPFGAAQLGGTVRLTLDVFDAPNATATLRLWVDGKGEILIPMKPERKSDRVRFHGEFCPEVLEIHWYCFIVDDGAGTVRFLGAPDGAVGGEGATYWTMPPSFQVTVYEKRATYPEWFEKGIVYQIFPDRFFRGDHWEDTVIPAVEAPQEGGVRRRLVQDWNTPPTYERDAQGDVAVWDFYGGTLEGITQKLDYLAGLGVSVLYLNPIFKASSNHRYDTGDYLEVDPMLGNLEDFERLAREAAKRGISIVLDGVFNHTGVDSRYFNLYGTYDSVGAGQSDNSPYRSWYLLKPDGTYDSWWGVKNMPAMDKNDPGWRNFIFGPDGVVQTWLERGARGWRLDVADELTDDFIAHIKEAETLIKPDAMLLGEVWEDASHKVAYSQMRHYFCGRELDGVMNYPFRAGLLAFLRGEQNAASFCEAMEALAENYPHHALHGSMNLLGSHDRARVLTLLAGAPEPDSLSDGERRTWRIHGEEMNTAKGRLWLALLVQMGWPGAPSIYYGDEAGLQGMTDPYNRGPFPWGHEDADVMTMTRNAIDIRRTLPCFVSGGFEALSVGEDVFGFWRGESIRGGSTWRAAAAASAGAQAGETAAKDAGEAAFEAAAERAEAGVGSRDGALEPMVNGPACVLVNRSTETTAMVELPMKAEAATEIVGNLRLAVSGDGKRLTLPLWPRGSAVVYFHPKERMAKELERGSGVFCAIRSVPNEAGPGTLGEPAKRFVDFLAAAGQRYWQILPVNPTDMNGSPYAGPSAFAGNAELIDTGGRPLKDAVTAMEASAAFERFVEDESEWLLPYATYQAVRDYLVEESPDGAVGGWGQWPESYRTYDASLAERPELAERVRYYEKVQYLFQIQWDDLKTYAHARGVQIIGDMPIYVASDSADTWAFTEYFSMEKDGAVLEVAGTKPDPTNPQGQLWGNPTYRWDAIKESGYHWWIERLRRSFALYDSVRLDHFLGFGRFWATPAGEPASAGHWVDGPGVDFFKAAYKEFGPLPVIAEDLGDVTPAIRALLAMTGIPGMDIVQYASSDVRHSFEPKEGNLAYTSTHDTTTLVGWVEESFFPRLKETVKERAWAMRQELEGSQGKNDGSQAPEPAAGTLEVSGAEGTAKQGESDDTSDTEASLTFETYVPSPLDKTLAQADIVREKAEAVKVAADIAERAMASAAVVCIQPLQDVILLDGRARMNVPGTAEGNWRWQATAQELEGAAETLRALTKETDRL